MMRVHGGANVPWDFSINANALGPCPQALEAVMKADRQRYPEGSYFELIEQLAHWHGVHANRVLLGGSASELIARMHVALRLLNGERTFVVSVPTPAYGDYAASALACGHQVIAQGTDQGIDMQWLTVPSSPLGENLSGEALAQRWVGGGVLSVIDAVYQPLLLDGHALPRSALDTAWSLWSPNKALGLCGVRGAYAIAPLHSSLHSSVASSLANKMRELEPSWVLSAEAQAMLGAWGSDSVQAWLADSLVRLRELKNIQLSMLEELGIRYQQSACNFFVVQLAEDAQLHAARLQALFSFGVALRDTHSMGLPRWARMRVHTAPAQNAFLSAWKEIV